MEDDPPTLLVNSEAQPTWKEMAQSPQFTSLVYPEVMRRLLTTTLIENEWGDDEEGGWGTDWVRFARMIGGLPSPPPLADKDGRESWIDEAVAAFARRNQMKTMWDLTFEEESRQ